MSDNLRRHPPYAVFLVAFCFLLAGGCGKKLTQYHPAPLREGKIVIPLTAVDDGSAHFFTYTQGGRQINFFVRSDAKGRVSSYFDACYTCYKHRKGYRVEGTDLVCNECSMKFGLADEQWDMKGGCDPILLKSSIENGTLVIDAAVIEKGAKLFR